jgi:hypothetical protein
MNPVEIGLYLFVAATWCCFYAYLRLLMSAIRTRCNDPEMVARARYKIWMMGLEEEAREELLQTCPDSPLVERYFRWFTAYKICLFLFGVVALIAWILYRVEAASS